MLGLSLLCHIFQLPLIGWVCSSNMLLFFLLRDLFSQAGLSLQPKVTSAVDFLLKEMAFPPGTIVAFAECNEVSSHKWKSRNFLNQFISNRPGRQLAWSSSIPHWYKWPNKLYFTHMVIVECIGDHSTVCDPTDGCDNGQHSHISQAKGTYIWYTWYIYDTKYVAWVKKSRSPGADNFLSQFMSTYPSQIPRVTRF